jgi:hypothetical protein
MNDRGKRHSRDNGQTQRSKKERNEWIQFEDSNEHNQPDYCNKRSRD